MSSAESTSLAPCLISAWQPRDCGEWIEPGIANTSRPASSGLARGDQRARGQRGLDHQRAARQPGDHAVALRKVLGQRRHAELELRQQQAVLGDAVRQRAMARRVDAVQPGADHGNRAAAAGQAALVRSAVDAQRHAGDDGQTGLAQVRARRRARCRCPVRSGCGCRRRPAPGRRAGRVALAHTAAAAGRRFRAAAPGSRRRRASVHGASGRRRARRSVAASCSAWRSGGAAKRAGQRGPSNSRSAAGLAANTASGEPQAASRRRAVSRPMPGVRSRRSQAARSSGRAIATALGTAAR